MSKSIIIKQASLNDLDKIIEIDERVYGGISEEVTATKEMMKSRIEIGKAWFFAAFVGDTLAGYLSLQPSEKGFEKFISWEDSTDNGTLKASFNEGGRYIYGVALTIDPDYRGLGITEKLFEVAAYKLISEKKKSVYFSGRMPGYWRYRDKMTPEEYYNKKIKLGRKRVAFDPQIRMYESFGLKKVRLVKDGFRGDKESGGYGIVFLAKNPFYYFPFPKFWGEFMRLLMKNKKISKVLLGS